MVRDGIGSVSEPFPMAIVLIFALFRPNGVKKGWWEMQICASADIASSSF